MTSYNPPPHTEEILVSFPADHVMLLTLNRPKSLNAMTPTMETDIGKVLDWFDDEPSLWVVILTGQGRVFAAGADLVAWSANVDNSSHSLAGEAVIASKNGFGSISRRSKSPKPIIAAVNGSAYGGGVEMILNCDIVIASEEATFALPEVKRGVVAAQGGMPRLARIAGHQLASEMLLLGRNITAQDAYGRFGFVNKVVPKDKILSTAIEWAKEMNTNSPDSVQSTKRAILLTNQKADVEDVVISHLRSKEGRRHYASENMKEGLMAFVEKRKPVWKNPAKL